jgi:hypothetical protein
MKDGRKMDIQTITTPEKLYQAVVDFLDSNYSEGHLVKTYDDACKCIIRFRGVYLELPAFYKKDKPFDGLQDTMDWCTKASGVVDNIVDDLDRNVIEGFIRNLNKLKGLPASGFHKINKNIWEKAKERAQKILKKYKDSKKRPRGLDTFSYCSTRTRLSYAASIISNLADVADRKAGRPNRWSHILTHNSIHKVPLIKQMEEAYTEMYFYRSVEKIYRLMDSDYTNALAKLEDRIFIVFEEWNKLNATNTGNLLDKYDKLKGLNLQDRVERLAHAYSIDSIVDTVLFGLNANSFFGGETREILVDGIIETLHNISRKIREKYQMKQAEKKMSEADLASIKQKSGRNKKRRKYTVEQLRRVQATFDHRHDGGMDVKRSWNEAADAFGIKSGKAAEMACRRYLKKQNK